MPKIGVLEPFDQENIEDFIKRMLSEREIRRATGEYDEIDACINYRGIDNIVFSTEGLTTFEEVALQLIDKYHEQLKLIAEEADMSYFASQDDDFFDDFINKMLDEKNKKQAAGDFKELTTDITHEGIEVSLNTTEFTNAKEAFAIFANRYHEEIAEQEMIAKIKKDQVL